jgi:predicted kinase
MATLTICRGISGSGKSTWARQQNAIVVCRDDIRDMLFETHKQDPHEYYAQSKDALSACESSVTVVQESMISGLLRAGKDVIVDNTNIEFKFVKQIAKIGYRHGADVTVKLFDVPLTDAIIRDQTRGAIGGREVGREVITRQYNRLKSNKSMTLPEVHYPRPYSGTPGKPRAFMVDIDGTLADYKNYRGPYDLNVGVDDVREKVADVVAELGNEYHVIVMSGRKEDCREDTIAWLEDNGIPYNQLFMRRSNDNRADNLIKADLFDEFVRDNFDVQFVFDDRDQVVDMWRRMGLDCFQVQEGDF